MPGQQGNNQAELPEVEHAKAAAEGPTGPPWGKPSRRRLKKRRRQRLPYLLSAVKLLEDAPELNSELRKGYVITNQHWQRIVEKSKR